MAELKWYVLRVISGQEKKVKSYLETEIERSKLVDFIPQVLIPSEKVYEMRNGKKRVRERNFFPGYVLVSADLSNGEAYHTVNNIPGVIEIAPLILFLCSPAASYVTGAGFVADGGYLA